MEGPMLLTYLNKAALPMSYKAYRGPSPTQVKLAVPGPMVDPGAARMAKYEPCHGGSGMVTKVLPKG